MSIDEQHPPTPAPDDEQADAQPVDTPADDQAVAGLQAGVDETDSEPSGEMPAIDEPAIADGEIVAVAAGEPVDVVHGEVPDAAETAVTEEAALPSEAAVEPPQADEAVTAEAAPDGVEDELDVAAEAALVPSEPEPTAADEPAADVDSNSGAVVAVAEAEAEEAPRLPAEQLLAIVEALVFASPEPLSLKTIVKLLADEPQEDVAAALEALKRQYDRPGGLHIVEIAGGLQITTRPDCHEWVRRLFHERTTQKLSVQALETLAVTAYRQPITAAEIGEIRGVNTSGVLSTLMERHLIKIVGRKNVVGRPFLYGTTREFLIRFGLKDLSDLPRVEDMAQALGFDAPAILRERSISEEMLPLEEEQH